VEAVNEAWEYELGEGEGARKRDRPVDREPPARVPFASAQPC
jgi:hypothetical protein